MRRLKTWMLCVVLVALCLPIRVEVSKLAWAISYDESSPIVWTKECLVVWRDIQNGDVWVGIGYGDVQWNYNAFSWSSE